ncbi:MAG: hypothetical protein K0M49_08650 [Arenimonas sp.]|nr:hypothetical protein [Rhizobium sp.]MBW8445687.1 hypothetical protein [Arenimonas sp.]
MGASVDVKMLRKVTDALVSAIVAKEERCVAERAKSALREIVLVFRVSGEDLIHLVKKRLKPVRDQLPNGDQRDVALIVPKNIAEIP